MTEPRITSDGFTAAQADEVLALVEAARLADGVAPLSEHGMLRLRYDGSDGGRDFVVMTGAVIAGYAYLDPPSGEGEGEVTGELVIHPEHRRQGLGRALTGELAVAAGGHVPRLWAHGDLPAAAALARAAGFERFRALWQMRRSLGEPLTQPLEGPALPAGRALRTFVPGQDEDEWLKLNGRAFAKHPEQGGWTRHDLDLREREPWFDPAGFFIAERDGRMTGFHWTKVHDPGSGGIGGVVPPGASRAWVRCTWSESIPTSRAAGWAGRSPWPDCATCATSGWPRRCSTWTRTTSPRSGCTRASASPGPRSTPCTGARPSADDLALVTVDAQRLVEFRGCQGPVRGRYRAQHLGVELYLIKGDAVVDTKIQLPWNRAHLRRWSRVRSLAPQVTCRHCSSA